MKSRRYMCASSESERCNHWHRTISGVVRCFRRESYGWKIVVVEPGLGPSELTFQENVEIEKHEREKIANAIDEYEIDNLALAREMGIKEGRAQALAVAIACSKEFVPIPEPGINDTGVMWRNAAVTRIVEALERLAAKEPGK